MKSGRSSVIVREQRKWTVGPDSSRCVGLKANDACQMSVLEQIRDSFSILLVSKCIVIMFMLP
jgi:hypothetical protein